MSKNIIFSEPDDIGTDGGHHLINLTYISRAEGAVDAQSLKAILELARTNNRANGISGILLFNRQFFLQTVEGSRPKINQLLTNLINDKRHFDLQIVDAEPISERRWDRWSMAYATPTEQNQKLYLKYAANRDFNPYLMSGAAIHKLIIAMSKTTPSPAELAARSATDNREKPQPEVRGGLLAKFINRS